MRVDNKFSPMISSLVAFMGCFVILSCGRSVIPSDTGVRKAEFCVLSGSNLVHEIVISSQARSGKAEIGKYVCQDGVTGQVYSADMSLVEFDQFWRKLSDVGAFALSNSTVPLEGDLSCFIFHNGISGKCFMIKKSDLNREGTFQQISQMFVNANDQRAYKKSFEGSAAELSKPSLDFLRALTKGCQGVRSK